MFSEMTQSGLVRPEYQQIDTWLKSQSIDDLKQASSEAETLFRKIGITFAVYGEGGDPVLRQIFENQRNEVAVSQRIGRLADEPKRQEQEAETDEDAAPLAHPPGMACPEGDRSRQQEERGEQREIVWSHAVLNTGRLC